MFNKLLASSVSIRQRAHGNTNVGQFQRTLPLTRTISHADKTSSDYSRISATRAKVEKKNRNYLNAKRIAISHHNYKRDESSLRLRVFTLLEGESSFSRFSQSKNSQKNNQQPRCQFSILKVNFFRFCSTLVQSTKPHKIETDSEAFIVCSHDADASSQ